MRGTVASGAQKEVDQWPLFLELANLLPRMRLRVVLAGPDVPHRLNGAQCSFSAACPPSLATAEPARSQLPLDCADSDGGQASIVPPSDGAEHAEMLARDSAAAGSLHLCFRRGLGHDVLPAIVAQFGHIDLAFGPNAGEAASSCVASDLHGGASCIALFCHL